MPNEPRVDRVKFHKDCGGYCRDTPLSSFQVFDNGLHMEQPEQYAQYTDTSGIDTLIVKVGTSILAHKDSRRTIYNMNCLSDDLTRLRGGLNVLLLSSGAIGLGRKARLRRGERIPEEEKSRPEQKRQDAIEGQTLLYELWRHHMYPQSVVESLVTHDDILDPQKQASLVSKYHNWLSQGKIPVINEDDARSLEEINIILKGERAFRDNDGLASLHAQFLKKAGYNPLLILLSNTDGIYTSESFSNGEYTPIRIVKDPTGLEEQALAEGSKRGRGGQISKIQASREAASSGVPVVIANGQYCNHDAGYQDRKGDSQRKYRVLDSILAGKEVGTRFLASCASK
jgi:glutamate 5-kinase